MRSGRGNEYSQKAMCGRYVSGMHADCSVSKESNSGTGPTGGAGCGESTGAAQDASAQPPAQDTGGQPAATYQPATQTQSAAYVTSGSPESGNLASEATEPEPVTTGTTEASYTDHYGYPTLSDDQQAPVYAPAPPPPLPQYEQPACPAENEIWTPGYWNYTTTGYYWVPGVWVLAPFVGGLWTPPYWAYEGAHYRFHRGYWAPHIGFYGGVSYGHGYVGHGYYGGYWHSGVFNYNRAVTNVNVTVVRNVYNYNVRVENVRVSYVGGPGGIQARPTQAELLVVRERPAPPVPAQIQHAQEAARNRAQFAAVNGGRPAVLAAPKPLEVAYRAPVFRPLPVQPRAAVPNVARPVPAQEQRPGPEARQAAPAQRLSQQAAPQNTPQARPGFQQRAEPAQRPGVNAPPAARMESRPAPQPRVETRPAPQPAARVAQPAPQPRVETRPAPVPPPRAEARPAPAPQPRVEARPAPAQQPRVRNLGPPRRSSRE